MQIQDCFLSQEIQKKPNCTLVEEEEARFKTIHGSQ